MRRAACPRAVASSRMSRSANRQPAPTIVFGAFDRHNFGDLLFAHVAQRMLPSRDLHFAGLADRDLREYGGHRVHAMGLLLATLKGRSPDVIHAGGELLACNAWEAAVMLAPPHDLQATLASENAWKRDGRAWAQRRFGVAALAPYVLSRASLGAPGERDLNHVIFNAVGGADLASRDPALRAEVLASLQDANDVSVRDHQTHAVLQAHGIKARLVPDPAVMVAELFGKTIRRRAAGSMLKALHAAFPHGYAAVQFSADFGDDATLDTLAREIDCMARRTGLGVVLFRAGAAPWHDDAACYERLASRLSAATSVSVFASLNVWDICALIAKSRVYCGSSLHGRIVAMAFALPRVNLQRASARESTTKQTAYAATWEPEEIAPAAVGINEMADGIGHALTAPASLLRDTAADLARRYREGFEPVRLGLG